MPSPDCATVIFILRLHLGHEEGRADATPCRPPKELGLAFELPSTSQAMVESLLNLHGGGVGFFEQGLREAWSEMAQGMEPPAHGELDFEARGRIERGMCVVDAQAAIPAHLSDAQRGVLARLALDKARAWFEVGWGKAVWSEAVDPPLLSARRAGGIDEIRAMFDARVEAARLGEVAQPAPAAPSRRM
jgi:hypothetical protein